MRARRPVVANAPVKIVQASCKAARELAFRPARRHRPPRLGTDTARKRCATPSRDGPYSSTRPNFARISDAAVQASHPQNFLPCALRSFAESSICFAVSSPNI